LAASTGRWIDDGVGRESSRSLEIDTKGRIKQHSGIRARKRQENEIDKTTITVRKRELRGFSIGLCWATDDDAKGLSCGQTRSKRL
jgi:hypothetical protein